MEIINIKAENAEGTQYAATISGQTWSGITEASRFWEPLQEAITNGEPVEPFVPYVASIAQMLTQTDAELVKIAARTIEDIIQERIDGGGFVAQPVKDKISERITLRAQL